MTVSSILTNFAASAAQGNIRVAQDAVDSDISRLSSGERIVRASDDVAGLSIGTTLRTTLSALTKAVDNASNANALLQIADAGLSNVGEILQRQKALASQATAGNLSDTERGFLNQEFQSLKEEISRLVTNTKFNQVTLLDGSIFDASNLRTLSDQNNIASATGQYLGYNVAFATGKAAADIDSIYDTIDPTTKSTSGINLLNLKDVADFNTAGLKGNPGFQVTYSGSNAVQITFKINGITFSGAIADTNTGTATVTLTGTRDSDGQAAGGSFALNLSAATVANSTDAKAYENRLNSAFNGELRFEQSRSLTGVSSSLTGVATGTTAITARLDDWRDPSLSNLDVKRATATQTGKISVQVNGKTFSYTISTGVTQITASTAIALVDENDAENRILFTTRGTAITLNDDTTEAILENDLKVAFKIGVGNTGLKFQTGSTSSDSIGVQIKGVGLSALGLLSASIDSVSNAEVASLAVDAAVNFVTSVRANVGALQSRFNYVSANVESAIQNLDQARAGYLDADLAKTSTELAKNQVKLQASVAVLAQANQVPTNLLKLLA